MSLARHFTICCARLLALCVSASFASIRAQSLPVSSLALRTGCCEPSVAAMFALRPPHYNSPGQRRGHGFKMLQTKVEMFKAGGHSENWRIITTQRNAKWHGRLRNCVQCHQRANWRPLALGQTQTDAHMHTQVVPIRTGTGRTGIRWKRRWRRSCRRGPPAMATATAT